MSVRTPVGLEPHTHVYKRISEGVRGRRGDRWTVGSRVTVRKATSCIYESRRILREPSGHRPLCRGVDIVSGRALRPFRSKTSRPSITRVGEDSNPAVHRCHFYARPSGVICDVEVLRYRYETLLERMQYTSSYHSSPMAVAVPIEAHRR